MFVVESGIVSLRDDALPALFDMGSDQTSILIFCKMSWKSCLFCFLEATFLYQNAPFKHILQPMPSSSAFYQYNLLSENPWGQVFILHIPPKPVKSEDVTLGLFLYPPNVPDHRVQKATTD